ncbi:hypothetical protein ACH42_05030 [Endozoicomonas sp. (ex Bugula neritina AB1)]|nr:hypothetical protein ACH42_05030 [Endozoicomonas sp. (ex Bugula neritina AB1)]
MSLAHSTADSLSSGLDRLLDRRICLGVTGFSGSGKTTMITSLIHQLRYYPDAALTAFPPALQNRLLGVEITPLSNLPLFPYSVGTDALSSSQWPKATREASACLIEIKYRTRKSLMPGKNSGIGRLFLEIHDYPGEWLLDLPLLEMSYSHWSLQFHHQLKESTVPGSQQLLENLSALDPLQPLPDFTLNALWQQLLDYLHASQKYGMTLIQPGRLLHMKPDSPENLTPFIPLFSKTEMTEEQLREIPEHSLFKLCEKHYQHYIDEWVRPFYRDTFQKVDRQVVLIDVLQGLNQGETILNDLCLGLTRVLQSFEYGHNSLIRKMFHPKVDRVAFAASKIDQVLPDQHEQVRSLTASLIREAQRRATFNNIDIRCEAVAAVRSTTCVEYQGRTLLKGNTDAGPGLLRHPLIPEHYPNDEDWEQLGQWQLRQLLPPTGLKLHNGGRLPHIRLDSLLNDLLGDKFL